MENRPCNINVVWLLSQDLHWLKAVRECTLFEVRWGHKLHWTITMTMDSFLSVCCHLPNKIKCLHSIKTKKWCASFASLSLSQCSFSSVNQSNQHTADSDRHPMDVRNLVWPVRLRHWVQLTSNQSINESIRVVTRKSIRNVNDKIMEYKMLWNWISKKTLIIITSWESVKHDWLSVSQLSLSLTVSQVK